MLKIKTKSYLLVLVLFVMGLVVLTGCNNTMEKNSESEVQNTVESSDNFVSEKDTEEESETESEVESTTEVIMPQYTYTQLEQVMYTTDTINVRNLPSTDGEKIGSLSIGKEVQVTGRCNETGWYRIDYNEMTAYVSGEYVSTEPPSSWVAKLDAAQTVSQMIVVTSDRMGSTDVTVSMHTKDTNGIWVEDFSTAGKIGRNGLGKEKEGDGKTPIGIYRFTDAFGIQPNPGISSMPYLQVDESYYWVDDPNSKYYNRFVTTNEVEMEWNSAEHICEVTKSYNYVLALNYNEECTPWMGCAIFLHCTNAAFGPTAGCIAIPDEYMIQVMVNLQQDCIIIIDTASEIYNY